MDRAISFEEACRTYVHRFTMDHVPAWAQRPMQNGNYAAPQFSSDREWYDNTNFPGENHVSRRSKYCETNNHTFPLGKFLTLPYRKGRR